MCSQRALDNLILGIRAVRLGLSGVKIGDVRIDKIIDKHPPASV